MESRITQAEKKQVAVLFGGCSSEHEVSLQSAAAVLERIDPTLYQTVAVGITRGGRWLRYTGSPQAVADGSWQADTAHTRPCRLSCDRTDHGLMEQQANGRWHIVRLDLVLPILHGRNGEDGTVQGLCELAGLPVAGCGALCSAVCMDKDKAHKLAAAAGVEAPAGFVAQAGDDIAIVAARAEALGWPLFVKPLRAGSSLGVSRVARRQALPAALRAAFAYDGAALVERAVPGCEVGCAVLGPDADGALLLGEPDEIELGEGVMHSGSGFFDYQEKYTLAHSAIHVPARLDRATMERIKRTAATVYRALGCRGFARVDLFLQPDGRLLFNEVNTIPGFTSHSRYPAMMQAAGYDFAAVLRLILAQALEGGPL